jgi:hypothetical protein
VVMNQGRITYDMNCRAEDVEDIIRKECGVSGKCSSG